MKPSGYSGKPLVQKLGYMPGDKVWVVNGPEAFLAYLDDENIVIADDPPATWLQAFFMSQKDFLGFFDQTKFVTVEKGLWFSWPKQRSHVPTDLTEQIFRDCLLPMGWVDTKVASVDETWSGLKFLRRKN